MKFNELIHGDLQAVHDHLHYREGVTERDVRAALTNAIKHIIELEKRLNEMQAGRYQGEAESEGGSHD